MLTERLRMRPFETDDAPAVLELFRDPEVGRWTGGHHRTIDDSRRLLATHARHQERHGFSLWAVEERDGGALVGEIGLQHLEQRGPEVEIGWVVARDRWGLGYATEGAARWLEAGFGELGLERVIATILPREHAVAARRRPARDDARGAAARLPRRAPDLRDQRCSWNSLSSSLEWIAPMRSRSGSVPAATISTAASSPARRSTSTRTSSCTSGSSART